MGTKTLRKIASITALGLALHAGTTIGLKAYTPKPTQDELTRIIQTEHPLAEARHLTTHKGKTLFTAYGTAPNTEIYSYPPLKRETKTPANETRPGISMQTRKIISLKNNMPPAEPLIYLALTAGLLVAATKHKRNTPLLTAIAAETFAYTLPTTQTIPGIAVSAEYLGMMLALTPLAIIASQLNKTPKNKPKNPLKTLEKIRELTEDAAPTPKTFKKLTQLTGTSDPEEALQRQSDITLRNLYAHLDFQSLNPQEDVARIGDYVLKRSNNRTTLEEEIETIKEREEICEQLKLKLPTIISSVIEIEQKYYFLMHHEGTPIAQTGTPKDFITMAKTLRELHHQLQSRRGHRTNYLDNIIKKTTRHTRQALTYVAQELRNAEYGPDLDFHGWNILKNKRTYCMIDHYDKGINKATIDLAKLMLSIPPQHFKETYPEMIEAYYTFIPDNLTKIIAAAIVATTKMAQERYRLDPEIPQRFIQNTKTLITHPSTSTTRIVLEQALNELNTTIQPCYQHNL